MDLGVFITDNKHQHKSWLPARRADLDFYFWKRYKTYLEEVKGWNSRVTGSLDRVSDEIVDLLAVIPKAAISFKEEVWSWEMYNQEKQQTIQQFVIKRQTLDIM
ncbi:hypothetical protein WDV93_08665 [Pantoea ananatis]